MKAIKSNNIVDKLVDWFKNFDAGKEKKVELIPQLEIIQKAKNIHVAHESLYGTSKSNYTVKKSSSSFNTNITPDECNDMFIRASKNGDIDMINNSFYMSKDSITLRNVLNALGQAVMTNKYKIIAKFPSELISKIDIKLLGIICINTARKDENKSFKLLLDRITNSLDEFKNDNAYKMMIDLRRGDFVYGIGENRNVILKKMFGSNPPTIDRLNNYIMDTTNPQCIYYGSEHTDDSDAVRHAKYLERHPKYNPLDVDYNTDDVRDIRVKKACKAGITHILESKENVKLHFLLDGFDPLKSLNKVEDRISFTNSEFRLIFRKWLENSVLVDKKVVFWDEDFKKKSPSDLFNLLGKEIFYIPKSLKIEATAMIRGWTNKEQETDSKYGKDRM